MPSSPSPKKTARKPKIAADAPSLDSPVPPKQVARESAKPRIRKPRPEEAREGTAALITTLAEHPLSSLEEIVAEINPVERLPEDIKLSVLAHALNANVSPPPIAPLAPSEERTPPPPNVVPPALEALPSLPPLPFQAMSRLALWVALAILGVLAVGIGWHSAQFPGEVNTLRPEQAARMQQLVVLSQTAASLKSPAERAALEKLLTESYFTLPQGLGAEASRALILTTLADLALHRADYPLALAAAHTARAYADLAHDPLTAAQAQLALTDGYLLAGHAADLAAPAAEETARLLATLPSGQAPLVLRLALTKASIAEAIATRETEEDQQRRQLDRARLKGKALALSEQLRADLNAEFQKRVLLQNEAATANDAAKMAQTSTDKEAYDARFSAELQSREALLKKETIEAMKTNPAIAELQESAIAAWRTALLMAETAGLAEKTQARQGLAAALLLKGTVLEAETLLQAATAEPTSDPWLKARTAFLLAQASAQKASSLTGDPAQAAATAGLAAATQAREILSSSVPTAAITDLLSQTQQRTADLETKLGRAEAATAQRSAATALQAQAAKVGGWPEILWNARQTLDEARAQFLQTSSLAASEHFELTQALHQALLTWQGQALANAPEEATQSAAATSLVLISDALDRYPWFPLLDDPSLSR